MRRLEKRWRGMLLARDGNKTADAGAQQAREGRQGKPPETSPDLVSAGDEVSQ